MPSYYGSDLWSITPGATAATLIAANLGINSGLSVGYDDSVYNLTAVGNVLYFTLSTGDASATTEVLWQSDGTPGQAGPVAYIDPVTQQSTAISFVYQIINFNGSIFYVQSGGGNAGARHVRSENRASGNRRSPVSGNALRLDSRRREPLLRRRDRYGRTGGLGHGQHAGRDRAVDRLELEPYRPVPHEPDERERDALFHGNRTEQPERALEIRRNPSRNSDGPGSAKQQLL